MPKYSKTNRGPVLKIVNKKDRPMFKNLSTAKDRHSEKKKNYSKLSVSTVCQQLNGRHAKTCLVPIPFEYDEPDDKIPVKANATEDNTTDYESYVVENIVKHTVEDCKIMYYVR